MPLRTSGGMLGVRAGRVLVGLVLGRADEDVLELAGAAGDDGGVEPVAVVDQFVLLGVGRGVGVQQPAWGCAGPVVQALAPTGPAGAPPDGLAGGAGGVDPGAGPAPAGGPAGSRPPPPGAGAPSRTRPAPGDPRPRARYGPTTSAGSSTRGTGPPSRAPPMSPVA